MSAKKRNRIKAITALALFFVIFAAMFAFSGSSPALANSAQTSWSGTSSNGAIVMDEQCPVVVERENLTFNLPSLPSNYYETYEEFLSYNGSVTAEYHLYNPAAYDVTVNLAFPFGKLPDYYYGYDEVPADPAAGAAYAITVDGEEVTKTLRHTYSYVYSDYDNPTDKARLRDGYMSEGLFDPQTEVTVYGYTAVLSDAGNKYVNAVASFPQFDAEQTALLCNANGVYGSKRVFSYSCRDGDVFYVYAIGQSIEPMVWSIEGGSCDMTEQYTTTLSELVLSTYDEESDISRSDWFNAVCDSIMDSRREVINNFVYYSNCNFNLGYQNILRWYAYSVTIPSGGRAVNAVTAPIYPSINTSRTPYYTYTYLLSPANDWAGFTGLHIRINTPYYFCGGTLGEFNRTDGGYYMYFDSLPEGELRFALSQSDIQVSFDGGSSNNGGIIFYFFVALIAVGCILLVGGLAAIIVAVVMLTKKSF